MIQFCYQHTHYYLLPAADNQSLLAFDAGYPCSLREYARSLKSTGYRLKQIKGVMVSHFHLDHAGLLRAFQDAGIQCLVFENQGEGIDEMERIIKRSYLKYQPIKKHALRPLETADSRAFLASIGIGGEVIQTPGHSDDSVSLITDDHNVLIGDLYPVSQIMPDDGKSHESWTRIRKMGGRFIFPSHAECFKLE